MVVDKEMKEWFKTAFLAEFINIFNARNYLPSLPRIPIIDAQESEWVNYLNELAKHDYNNLDMWKFLTLLLDRKQASPAICDRINKLLALRTKESVKNG